MVNQAENKPLFSLVAGRGHGPNSWRFVLQELRRKGYESIAPDLPIGDKDCSLDEHAQILSDAEALQTEGEIIRVGWSWGANVIPRSVGQTAVKKLLYIAPAFQETTVHSHPNRELISTNHGMLYDMLRCHEGEERREFARMAFYHDVVRSYGELSADEIVEQAVADLREHPYHDEEPILTVLPKLPAGIIVLTRDRVITLESQERTAKALGVKPIKIESGHAPMYSRPVLLAKRLIGFANAQN